MTIPEILTQIQHHARELTRLHSEYQDAVTRNPEMDVQTAIASACERFQVLPVVINRHTRPERHCLARFHAWTLLSQSGWSSQKIARAFNRNHGSILNGLRRYKNLAEVQPKLLTPVKETLTT